MSFTPEEIEIMDKEVDEDMDDQELEPPVFDAEDADETEDIDGSQDIDSTDEYVKEARYKGFDFEDRMYNLRYVLDRLTN